MIILSNSDPIVRGTSGDVGRSFEVGYNYERLAVGLLYLNSTADFTLDSFLGSTRILESDFDAVSRELYSDGTIVNKRLDYNQRPYVIVTQYPSGKIALSYRIFQQNQDGDFLFSAESKLPSGWTALDLNEYLHSRKDFNGDNNSNFSPD